MNKKLLPMELFLNYAKCTQQALKSLVARQLRTCGYNVIEQPSFIIAEGDIPIALVAHLDTVFHEESRSNINIFYDSTKKVMWSPNGLGADDRAGITMIMYLIRTTNLRPHIIFTTNEETDAKGACTLASYTMPFQKLSYIIELDRRGASDCVFYECNNPNFVDYIESFGFEENFGTFTDISILCPAWGIAGVNLSVGYYNEHSFIEYLNWNEWALTYSRLKEMLQEKTGKVVWNYIPFKVPKREGHSCEFCGSIIDPALVQLINLDGVEIELCPICLSETNHRTCRKCGKKFIPFINTDLCNLCE